MPDDVVLNKCAIIERCVRRVREVYAGDDENLTGDITKQDSMILNIQRACEAAIDLAMHLVRKNRLGVPQESRDAFRMLEKASILEPDLAGSLSAMVGFRNIAVHAYQDMDLDKVRLIILERLDDLLAFSSLALRRHASPQANQGTVKRKG